MRISFVALLVVGMAVLGCNRSGDSKSKGGTESAKSGKLTSADPSLFTVEVQDMV